MGALLIGRIDHRPYSDSDQAAGSMIVVEMQHRVALDYCSKWNNASQKVIIAATISTYRLAMAL
jgi:hypothetical protein